MTITYCFTNSTARNLGCASALTGLLLAGCAATTSAPETAEENEQGSAVSQVRDERPPTDPEVMYRVWAAEFSGAARDMEKAAEEYLAAALESDDPEISQRATEVALAAQAWQYAAMAADRWVQLAPASRTARETAVRALLAHGDYTGAEHHLKGLIDLLGDESWQGWDAVAALVAGTRNTVKAEEMLDRLMTEEGASENPFALLAKSQLTARRGEFAAARALAAEAIDRAPEVARLHAWAGRLALTVQDEAAALEHYRQAWQLEPANRVHALVYAEFLKQKGEGAQANRVLGNIPDEPEVRFTRIAFALDTGDAKLADELFAGFDTAEYSDPVEHAFQAARSAELLGRKRAAIEWYARLEGTERESVATLRRAVLLSELGQLDEAREVLQSARNTGSDTARLETFVAEAQILLDADQPADALEVLDQAVADYPQDVRVLYTRALVAVELDRLELAESDLRLIIAQDPENGAALNALGYTLADRTERLDEAEQLINAAYGLQPDEPSILDSMGWIAYRRGRLEEAEKYLREAFARERNAEIAAHLGEVLWMREKHADARAMWREGLEIDPEDSVLRETLERFDFEH